MPISTYGFLYPPFVSIVASPSVQSLSFSQDNKRYAFGTIDAINYNCIRTQKGKPVIFDMQDSVLVTHGRDSYFIVDEKKILFQEFIPL